MQRRRARDVPSCGGMSNSLTPPPAPSRPNVRALLIQQQRATPDLLLPLLIRTPSLVLLWTIALGIVVSALALSRVRVPRTVRATVVVPIAGADSLTPLLLLPSTAGAYVIPGQLATVDTGGSGTIVVPIVSTPVPLNRRALPPWLARIEKDSGTIAARLERCHAERCVPFSPGAAYDATAALGTRSLASYALPRS